MIEIFGMSPTSFLLSCAMVGICGGVLISFILMVYEVRKDEKEKKIKEDQIKKGMKSYYQNPDGVV